MRNKHIYIYAHIFINVPTCANTEVQVSKILPPMQKPVIINKSLSKTIPEASLVDALASLASRIHHYSVITEGGGDQGDSSDHITIHVIWMVVSWAGFLQAAVGILFHVGWPLLDKSYKSSQSATHKHSATVGWSPWRRRKAPLLKMLCILQRHAMTMESGQNLQKKNRNATCEDSVGIYVELTSDEKGQRCPFCKPGFGSLKRKFFGNWITSTWSWSLWLSLEGLVALLLHYSTILKHHLGSSEYVNSPLVPMIGW